MCIRIKIIIDNRTGKVVNEVDRNNVEKKIRENIILEYFLNDLFSAFVTSKILTAKAIPMHSANIDGSTEGPQILFLAVQPIAYLLIEVLNSCMNISFLLYLVINPTAHDTRAPYLNDSIALFIILLLVTRETSIEKKIPTVKKRKLLKVVRISSNVLKNVDNKQETQNAKIKTMAVNEFWFIFSFEFSRSKINKVRIIYAITKPQVIAILNP